MRVLLIAGGGPAIQIQTALASAGFQTYMTDEGEEGVDLAKTFEYDAILFYPEMLLDGVDVVRAARKAKITAPILVISGDSKAETKVAALNAGADDYITTPALTDEIVARLHAVIRRAKGHTSQTIRVGDHLAIDIGAKCVLVDGRPVHLTGREYMILEALCLRKGQALTKDALLDHVYGGMDEPEIKIIDVYVCKIRKKLDEAGAGGHLITIWGRGYKIADVPEHKRVASIDFIERRLTDKERILRALVTADRAMRPFELARACEFKPADIYAKIQLSTRHGLVVNDGRRERGGALYIPTQVGRDWLASLDRRAAA